MRKILDRLTALVMVMLMFIQTCVPAITSFAKEEELDKRYVIQKLETLKQDTYANFSLNLATILDDKNLDTDTNVKFTLNATSTDSNIKLLVRKDFSLYDERTFDKVEDAYKEFDKVDKSLKDQGLSLDVSVVQEGEKYRIKNNYVPQAGKEDFGSDYKVYSLKVVPTFDFDKQGLYNKLPENDKLSQEHNLQLAEQRRLQQDGEVPEADKHNVTYIFDFKVDKSVETKLTTIALNKDANNPLEVKQNADLFAAILNDRTYSVYQTEQLPAEVTSSIEHKKEVAKKKAEADAKAKAEADAKAKKEADEKAKKEADEKAKKDAKAKEEADAKAKQEADKLKAEEAKKSEEQKALDKKAKQEADAKAKAEAEAKAKAEAEKLKAEAEAKQKAEAKAKQEQLAKEQAEAEAKKAAEEKAKKDLENKKLLGLVKDTEEKQEEEPIIKKKEIKEEVKSEPATPQERKQKAEEFDKALKERKEEIKKSEDKKDANNKEDNKKTTDKKEVSKETKGLLEGIKEFFGFSNLQKADRELKAILSVKANGLKEVQALLSSFEDKYHLTQEEQAKLMDDNKDAIKALIEKDADKNFNPQMLLDMSPEVNPQAVGAENLNLDGKKFHVKTVFQTSNAGGAIQPYQYFKIHLDDKLKVNDPNTLKPIMYNGRVIAKPTYNKDKDDNTITYDIVGTIPENISVPLDIPVDYNPDKITLDSDGTFTVINKVSGLGIVNPPKDLVPQRVDKNGGPAGSIIETGRHDVIQIFDNEHDRTYSVNVDAHGKPAVENGKIKGINWTVKVHSTDDLKNLGFRLNVTAVEGSGLEKIDNVKLDGKDVTLTPQLKGATGIVDSKHHNLQTNATDLLYTFYTPVERVQSAYMLDISGILTNKNNILGAARLVLDDVYKADAISEATPTRVGMNNRTTIQGTFKSANEAEWTVTDQVSSGDEKEPNANKGLPLETRELEGSQKFKSGKSVVYGIDTNPSSSTYGQMVVKRNLKTDLTKVPDKEKDPEGAQAVGNIAVYKIDTNLTDATSDENTAKDYRLSGVSLSKYKDVIVEQEWTLPKGQNMPKQKIEVVDKATGNVIASKEVGAEAGSSRTITIPNVKFWDFKEENGKQVYVANKLGIKQNLPTDPFDVDGQKYKYSENSNYYKEDAKTYLVRNSAVKDGKTLTSFTVIKIDKNKDKDGKDIKLEGADYYLLGAGVGVTTDKNGQATFKNIEPGNYVLKETKAPNGYKLDQETKNVTITESGEIVVTGNNAVLTTGSSKTQMVEHSNYPNWPDFMNAMHYGKVDANGNVEFYVYLKPRAKQAGGSTDKDTDLNITLPGVSLKDANVTAYDVHPYYRDQVRKAMVDQDLSSVNNITSGSNLINDTRNKKVITGKTIQSANPGENAYQIYFPKERFADDWGFLVKVTGNIGKKDSTNLSYDWLVDGKPGDSNIRQNVTLNKNTNKDDIPTITIKNEAFKQSEIKISKFANEFNADGKRKRAPNAEFVLKDSNDNVLANKLTDADGNVNFGSHIPGTYTIEEINAPDGYIKSNVYYEVTVDESNKVTYKPKFKTGSGQPVIGEDYWIEKGAETQTETKPEVTNVSQRLEYNEGNANSWGKRPNVWEAYMFESLKYHADITLKDGSPGKRFEIQFDPNLDFTQYFSGFPKIRKDGKDIADPYFDYKTNLLTYVFNKNSNQGQTIVSIDLKGMIPDKYYFQNTGTKPFTITVAPGKQNVDGQQTITKDIQADYGRYDTGIGHPSQSYYFRDIYQADDGQWYVTAMAYFNPMADSRTSKTLQFNWMSTNYDKNTRIARQEGRGYKPAYDLVDVKVYRTEPNIGKIKDGNDIITVNYNMPLSYGVRPEQDPSTYSLLYHTAINPGQKTSSSANGVSLEYDPSRIKTTGGVHTTYPLKVRMPNISPQKEGFIVEQTFKITDINNFINLSRIFYMNNGATSDAKGMESAFANSANFNTAKADQTGEEIPKYYEEITGLINKKYIPGEFKITKLDQADRNKKLPGATFVLRPEYGSPIYRTSNDKGEISFTGLAPGRYILEEFRAPNEYIITDKQWQVFVFNDGNVRITEAGVSGSTQFYDGKKLNIEVTNKPKGQDFVIYKKDDKGNPLQGAKFKLTKHNDPRFKEIEKESDEKGLVKFGALQYGTYIIEEISPPSGYKPLDKKWVLVIDKNGKKVYNYREQSSNHNKLNSILEKANVNWVDVGNRSLEGWNLYDNRRADWTANYPTPFKLGTRIVGINKTDGYVIQRYILNPESLNIGATTATIHREKPEYPNMDWYDGKAKANIDYQVFTLDKAVTGDIEDIRLAEYNPMNITEQVTASPDNTRFGEPPRLKLEFPQTTKPILVDIKIPYKDFNEGVGTGMDWTENGVTYWKSDYYERVNIIKDAGPVLEQSKGIQGSYISDDSLDINNELQTYKFNLKKVKEGTTPSAIQGATFKLTGPGESKEERPMTTGSDGTISFDNLKPGTYKLEETAPAPGYEKANISWTVTITKDGKKYIKENATNSGGNRAPLNSNQRNARVSVQSNSNIISRYLLNLNAASNIPELDISGNLMDISNPLRAGKGWEDVDSSRSSIASHQDSAEGEIQTKITKINKDKDTKQFTQVFLIDGSKSKSAPIMVNFRGADGSSSSLGTIKVYQLAANATIDNLVSSKNINHNGPFPDGNIGGSTINFPKANNKYAIEITTSYSDNQKLGFEGRFIYDRTKNPPSNWKNVSAKESYNSASDINLETYSVKTGQTSNGSISIKDNKTTGLKENDPVTVEVTPASNYELDTLTYTDSQNNAVNIDKSSKTFTMPASDVTVNATFRPKEQQPTKHKVKTQTSTNGTFTVDKTEAAAGEEVTITPKPNNGFVVKEIYVGSSSGPVTVTNNKFTMPNSEVYVRVDFEVQKTTEYTIASYSDANGNSVTPNLNKATKNQKVDLTVDAAQGYTIDKIWIEDQAGTKIQDVTNNTFNMPDKNVVIKATFKRTEFSIKTSVNDPNLGSVTVNPSKAKAGDPVTVTVTPKDSTVEVTDVKLDNISIGPKLVDGKYTFPMPANNVTVSVTFNKKTYETFSVYALGTEGLGSVAITQISDMNNKKAREGEVVKFRVDAKPGWEVIKENVYVNQVHGGGRVKLDFDGVNGSFIMPKDDVTIYAQDYKEETVPAGSKTADAISGINGGYVTVSQRINKPGEKVRFTLTPWDGYKNISQSVSYAQGGTPVPVLSDEQGYYFIMPAANVSVSGTFQKVTTPGAYKVILGQAQNGKVSASPTSANANEEITLSAVASPGYVFKGYTVTDANGKAVPMSGNKFKMPASAVSVSATFEYAGKEIDKDKFAEITNKQTGLDFKIYKHDFRDRPLEGATFELYNADKDYKITDKDATGKEKASMTGISGADGIVKFIKNNNEVKLTPGYYVMREVTSPQGYKKINADWKIRVYEDPTTGTMKAEYKGPEKTPTNFVTSDKAKDANTKNGTTYLKDAGSGIKYASKMTYINTESKTFIQRIYVDTRNYTGDEKVNVRITPEIKREEFDTPGQHPQIGYDGKYGVKTAYRSTYKIADLPENVDDTKLNDILSIYDLSDPNVSMINTARWRPFDWGFDEDQLNLDKGVYYIDVEGFYDDNITEEQIGKIEMNIDFLTERYFYSQAKDQYGNFYWQKDGSYQSGAAALGAVYEKDVVDSTGKVIHKKGEPTEWGKLTSLDNKYPNWVGKKVKWTNGAEYQTGMIAVPEGVEKKDIAKVKTTINIKPLYSSNTTNQISQDGMSIINDEETYNVTFSKHGQDDPNEKIDGEEVTKRRLEGAVFKLQEERLGRFIDLPESTVASAFNGYFGFRGLSPGRYRLIEVKAPKDYKPIDGPLLYFTVETIKTNSGKLVHPETGEVVDIKSITIKFSDNDPESHKLETLQMVDKDGKIVNIKDAKSADINVENTKIINPHATDPAKRQVLLKDLKIVGANGNYNIKDAKIVPGSSGYISLEYDKANGVYQYVPEKSTSEKNGKLVDFVTSATAKNMGKIVNTKPGKGKVILKKVDQDAQAIKADNLKPGAQFKLTNILNGTTTTKTVDEKGEIVFDQLPIGQYRLEEVASPSGYINNHQIWNFTVGGKELDPYAGEAPQRKDNLSDKITLSKSEMTVINPENKDNKQKADGEIHPHLGEVFEFENTFKLDSNTKINPGDYFVLKLTDNIDLNGIFEDEASNLDMFADGVGTIAKAEYNKKEGTITYTFTDYAKTYQLAEFSNKLTAFINLNKVKNSDSKETVGFSVNNNTDQQKSIKVVYDSMTATENDKTSFMNLGSKITKFNPETGEFVHYYYINRDKKYIGPSKFIYHSDQNIYDLKISEIAISDNSDIDDVMPESFGLEENNSKYTAKEKVSVQYLYKGQEREVVYPKELNSNNSYIIKVTGTVYGENKSAYVGHGKLDRTYQNPNNYLYVTRKDQVYGFANSTNAKADLSIQAVNPENKIRFLKVDQDGKPLKGASFSLNIQDENGNWNDYQGGIKTSGDDGIVEFKQLKVGKYQLVETDAPVGYEKLSGAILEFEVDSSGNIHRKKDATPSTDPNHKPVSVDESGSTPIPVVNKKPQKVKFVKVDATEKTKLKGAEFEVWYKANETDEKYTTKLKVYEKTTNGKTERLVIKEGDNVPGGYTHVEGDKFITGTDGLVEFNVLDNGYYALKEVKAPSRYIKPRDYVKQFTYLNGKVKVDDKEQSGEFVTEVSAKKKATWQYTWGYVNCYDTSITMKYNAEKMPITYTKDNSKLTLSGLPKASQPTGDKVIDKGISITAYLTDGKNNSSQKTITLNTNEYSGDYATKVIDLFALVKELEGKTTNEDITTKKTLVLSMNSHLYLDTELDLGSKVVIGDKIKEDRSFHIGTKGKAYEDHSYSFTTKGTVDLSKPIEIENKKGVYPLTGAMGIIGFLVIGGIMMATAYYKYRRKRRESALS